MSAKTFEKPDEQTMLTAMVLQDIKDTLQSQKNSDATTIQAEAPNAYYWAQFDPSDEEQWFDEFYGDIREIPNFGMSIANSKLSVLEQLRDRGVIRHFEVNSAQEDVGLNQPIEIIRSFRVKPNLVKFLKYYEKYTKAAKPYLEKYSSPPTDESVHRTDEVAPTACVKIDGTNVLIGYADKELILQKKVRLDGGLYNFMHYLQSHTEKTIALADVQALDYCGSYKDLGEQVRYLGFDKKIKPIFFEVSEKRVRFTPKVALTQEQQHSFDNYLKALRK